MNHEVPCAFCGGDTRGLCAEVPGCATTSAAARCQHYTGRYYGLTQTEREEIAVLKQSATDEKMASIQSTLPREISPGVRAQVSALKEDARRRRWTEENLPMDRRHRMMLREAPRRPELEKLMPSQRIYFAHPMPDYDTVLEAAALQAIEHEFGPEFHIINPNTPEHQKAYLDGGSKFEYWTDLARSCGTVVFMALPNRWIGSGVWKEVEAAILGNWRVFELERNLSLGFFRVAHLDVGRCLSVEETRRTTRMILQYKELYGG